MYRKVTTQAEFDAAVSEGATGIDIRSEAGVWITVTACDSSTVTACDSSTVTAYGSSTVRAYGSSTVRAYGSSTVRAYGSSTVTAYGSSTVTAYGSSTVTACDSSTVTAYGSSTVTACDSSTVTACDSSTVTACGSSTVRACGSSTVRACDSSTVTACDSSTVRACDSSTVTAYDSSTVTAYGSSTVRASKYVAVHLHSQRVTLSGGVVIDVTALDTHTADGWLGYYGLENDDDAVTVYKAVDKNLDAGHGYTITRYAVGKVVTAQDWENTQACGHGLHFSASPSHAVRYYGGSSDARFLACLVKKSEMVALGDKIKAKSCLVLGEVDEHLRQVAS